MPTFGLEEEVFIVNGQGRVSPQSFYYMARLLWRDPRRHYFNIASNMARGEDVRQGAMSCMEVATAIHGDAQGLLNDLLSLRSELASLCDERLVAVGHLFDYKAPTNIAALHLHIGDVKEPERVYANIAYFLPLLQLLTMSSPITRDGEAGESYRIREGFAIGPLRDDPSYRFQDLIFARRLGTIEIRSLDSVWEPVRLRYLLDAIQAIASSSFAYPYDRAEYNLLRNQVAEEGWSPRTNAKLEERKSSLSEIVDIPAELWRRTPSEVLRRLVKIHGTDQAYSVLDHFYRRSGGMTYEDVRRAETAAFEDAEPNSGARPSVAPPAKLGGATRALRSAFGVAGFLLPNLPYKIYKFRKEW